MPERQQSFLHQLANGELDEEERELVLAELYGSGLFEGPLPWSPEGQPAPQVEGAGDVDGCPPRVRGSEHTGRSDGAVGPADPCMEDGPTVLLSTQESSGSVVSFASAAPHDAQEGGEPEDAGEESGNEAIRLPRVAGRR